MDDSFSPQSGSPQSDARQSDARQSGPQAQPADAIRPPALGVDPIVRRRAAARALAALGRMRVDCGRPRQGLALLLSAQRLGDESPTLMRSVAHALVLAGAAARALPLIERLAADLVAPEDRRAALYLKSRALLALGRVEEAQAAFAARRGL